MPARRRAEPAAWVALLILTGVWTWWGVKEGAYFGTVFYAGAIVLACGAVLLAFGSSREAGLRLPRGIVIGFAALLGLGVWYGMSALWSPSPDIAVADAQHVFVYVLAGGLGLWLAVLLGQRSGLALAPLVIAAAVAGGVTAAVMLTGDDLQKYLVDDGTLSYPLGYRNANAAFFLIAVWPALGLASDRELAWPLRALAAGTATVCVDLAIMSQSRGSMIATPVALVTFLVLSPHRARALLWLLVVLIPAAGILPATIDLYAAGEDAVVTDALDELREAGRAVAGTAALAILLGAVWAHLEPGAMRIAGRAGVSWNRVVAGLGVVLAIAGAVAFVVKVGDPVDWVDARFDELGAGNPAREGQATRFGFDAGSRRTDLWRVALDDAGENPLRGDGGGGYQYSYTLHRDVANQYAHDAHSVELEVLSELGYPGLALLLVGLGGIGFVALRSLRLDQSTAGLSAAALSAFAYWLAHSSVDWFWAYPALTAPAFALLGAACAPAVTYAGAEAGRWARRAIAVGAALLAISMVAPFLSQRYLDEAYGIWGNDLERAYDDLDRAETLNPLTDQTFLAEGAIAREVGDRARAIDAFERAVEKRPEEWAGHYFLATLYRNRDPRRALAEAERAVELNPLGERVEALRRSLARSAREGG